jgi:hypothetical protein
MMMMRSRNRLQGNVSIIFIIISNSSIIIIVIITSSQLFARPLTAVCVKPVPKGRRR